MNLSIFDVEFTACGAGREMAMFTAERPEVLSAASSESSAATDSMKWRRRCRLCDAQLATTFVDLGMSPLCESFLRDDQIDQMEAYYPLHALVCSECFLVQLQGYVAPEHIFTEYAYFSSYSTSW